MVGISRYWSRTGGVKGVKTATASVLSGVMMSMAVFAGDNKPDLQLSAWTLQGTGNNGLTTSNGVLSVSGTSGGGSSYWLSPPLALSSQSVYALDFACSFLQGGTGDPWHVAGSPQVGMTSYNISLGWWAGKDWADYRFIIATPDKIIPARSKLRFGEVGMRMGKVLYKNISMTEVEPSYRHSGSIVLGAGEVIYDNRYQFITRYNVYGNQSRPLKSFLCAFNSNRWIFFKDDYVIYEHNITGFVQKSGYIELHIDWYGSGKLSVMAKSSAESDGKWLKIGETSKPGDIRFKLPSELFPADTVTVKLHCDSNLLFKGDFAPGAIQVGAYRYFSVTGRNFHGVLKGKTTYLVKGKK